MLYDGCFGSVHDRETAADKRDKSLQIYIRVEGGAEEG